MVPALALLAAIPALNGSAAAQVPPPHISSIEVGRDTVRFYARTGEFTGAEWGAYAYVRSARRWVMLDGPRRPRPRLVPWESRDAVHIAPGFTLVGRPRPGHAPPGFSRFDVVSRADGTRHPVHAEVSEADRWAVAQHDLWLLYQFHMPAPKLSDNVSAWARTDDAVWFKTYGEDMGGLIRFDLPTRRFTAVLDTTLNHLATRAMAATRGSIWLAGEMYPTPVRESGVLRYDVASRRWARYTTANAPLPGDSVLAMAGGGDTLFVATTQGLALLDAASGRWDVRWYRTVAAVDTVDATGDEYSDEEGRRRFPADSAAVVAPRVELATERPPHEAGQGLVVRLAEALSAHLSPRTMEPDSFFALIRRIPAAHFDSAARRKRPLARALAHPEIARIMFPGPGSDERSLSLEGIVAVGLLGDRRYLPELRRIAAANYLDEEGRAELALALWRLGDTSLVPDVRARAGNGSFGFNDFRYVEALAQTGDTAAIPLILDYARRTGVSASYHAVYLLAPPARWRTVMADAAADPRAQLAFLAYITYGYARVDTISDSTVRRSLSRLAKSVLETPASGEGAKAMRHAHYRAAKLALDLGDASLVPSLIPLLDDSADYATAMRTLILLTGVDSAPAPPRPTAAQRAAARRFWTAWWTEHRGGFWTAWWRSLRGGFPAVPRDRGIDALRRWRMRWELGRAG